MPGMERGRRSARKPAGGSRIGELLATDGLHLAQVLVDLGLDVRVDLAAVVIILGAGLGGDGEALGHGHTQIGHLSQVGALAAQQLPHGAVAL